MSHGVFGQVLLVGLRQPPCVPYSSHPPMPYFQVTQQNMRMEVAGGSSSMLGYGGRTPAMYHSTPSPRTFRSSTASRLNLYPCPRPVAMLMIGSHTSTKPTSSRRGVLPPTMTRRPPKSFFTVAALRRYSVSFSGLVPSSPM